MTTLVPLALLQDSDDMHRDHRHSVNHFGAYAVEILEHAGLPFVPIQRAALLEPGLPPLVLLPYPLRLTPAEVAALERHVRGGGALVACGGVEGADDLFGLLTTRRHLDRGRLTWPAGALDLPGGLIPVWGGQLVQAGDGQAAALVAGELRSEAGETGSALVLQPRGQGVTCFLAVDVSRSVVEMQQGVPVLGDAPGAPDGSAKLDDRILKTDDGAVIDWELRDDGPEGSAYLTPFADRLRELLIAALVACAERTGTALCMRWYWPDALSAVALLSYDTDSNEDADGRAFLKVVSSLEVHGSWCVMFPGGYEHATYDGIRDYGDEIALHFDGLTTDLNGSPHCGWSQADFDHQLAWLEHETGIADVFSQKNHVTRWEGWVEFFRWVERSGIRIDQSKGPSKIGNLGFTFGTCHPWRPMEDALRGNRLMDVLELTFHTHDMHHSERRVELRRRILDAAREHAGVAHFIFHPQRIHESGQPEAIADIVGYARERGVAWWTSERIGRWEEARRGADVAVERGADGRVRVHAKRAPQGLTVLLFGLGAGAWESEAAPVQRFELMGRSAWSVTLPAGDSEVTLTQAPVGPSV